MEMSCRKKFPLLIFLQFFKKIKKEKEENFIYKILHFASCMQNNMQKIESGWMSEWESRREKYIK